MHRDEGVELSFERRTSHTERPLMEALERGAWHGAWTITLGSLPAALAYVLRYGWMHLPWAALAAQLGSFVAVAGAFYGGGMAFGEALARCVRVRRRMRAILTVALPAGLAGIGGLAPGAFAAERFGRIPAPYFGTVEILIVGVLAFFLLGAALLRAEGVPALRALPALGLALVAPLACGLAAAALVPSTGWALDTLVLDAADHSPSLALFGATFGAMVGVIFGGLLGTARAFLVHRGRRGELSGGARSRGSA